MKAVTVENRAGQPFEHEGRRITPFVQAVQVRLPGSNGGLVWNRPVSLLVQEADGSEQTLPVIDVTRQAQIMLLGFGLVGGLLFWLARRK